MTMANRIGVALLAGLLGPAALPASAQTLQSRLSNCLAIPGVLQRLACYDGVAKSAGLAPTATNGAGPAPAVHAAPTPAPARMAAAPVAVAPATDSFGSEKLVHPPADPAKPNRIAADISAIAFNPFGKFTVTLANGQVWRQLDSDSDTVKPHANLHNVRISRGLMGSYDLRFGDNSRVYKVTRVR